MDDVFIDKTFMRLSGLSMPSAKVALCRLSERGWITPAGPRSDVYYNTIKNADAASENRCDVSSADTANQLTSKREIRNQMRSFSVFDLFEIRIYGINKLEQWRSQGVWSTLHRQWMDVLNFGSDDQLRKTMLSNSDKSIELRQVSPFPGMLPKDVVEKLRGETL